MNGYGKSIHIRNLKNFLKDFNWRSEFDDQHVSKNYHFLTDSVNNSLRDLVSVNVQRLENFKNLIIGRLNINSIWNKFETTSDIARNFSIFHISESTSDSTFSNSQRKINGYKVFRRDHNRYGGKLFWYTNEEISCKILNQQTASSSSQLLPCNFFRLNVNGFC